MSRLLRTPVLWARSDHEMCSSGKGKVGPGDWFGGSVQREWTVAFKGAFRPEAERESGVASLGSLLIPEEES